VIPYEHVDDPVRDAFRERSWFADHPRAKTSSVVGRAGPLEKDAATLPSATGGQIGLVILAGHFYDRIRKPEHPAGTTKISSLELYLTVAFGGLTETRHRLHSWGGSSGLGGFSRTRDAGCEKVFRQGIPPARCHFRIGADRWGI
jgi:hypothetical protein